MIVEICFMDKQTLSSSNIVDYQPGKLPVSHWPVDSVLRGEGKRSFLAEDQ